MCVEWGDVTLRWSLRAEVSSGEAPVGRSQMGSTFTWIFNEQLDRLQEGDRHYYFNQLKDAPLPLADIGSQHFSDLIMRNTGIEHMHYSAFKVSEKVELGAGFARQPAERPNVVSAIATITPDITLQQPAMAKPMANAKTDSICWSDTISPPPRIARLILRRAQPRAPQHP